MTVWEERVSEQAKEQGAQRRTWLLAGGLVLGLGVVGAVLGSFFAGPSIEERARVEYLAGGEAFHQGDLGTAEQHLLAAIELAPEDDRTWHLLGDTRLASSRYGDAAIAYERAVALDPKKLPSWINLARAHKLGGEREKARSALQKARALAPDDVAVLTEAAELALAASDLPASRELYQRALERAKGPTKAELHEKLAELDELAGDAAAAAAQLTAAAREAPTRERWARAGQAEVKARRLVEAADAFAQEAGLTDDGAPWELVGEIRAALGRSEEARAAYDKANAKGDRVGACVGLGRLALAAGDKAGASLYADRALAGFGEEEPVQSAVELSLLFLELERAEPAAVLLSTVIAELDEAPIHALYARALRASGKLDDAEEACSRSRKKKQVDEASLEPPLRAALEACRLPTP